MSDTLNVRTETEGERATPADWKSVVRAGRGGKRSRAAVVAAVVFGAVTIGVGVVTVLSIREENKALTCDDLVAPVTAKPDRELALLVDGAGDAEPYLNDISLGIDQAFKAMPANTPFILRAAIVTNRTVDIGTTSACLTQPLAISSANNTKQMVVVTKAIRHALEGHAANPTAAPAMWQQGRALAATERDRKVTVALIGSWHLAVDGQPATCGQTSGAAAETDDLVKRCVEQGLLQPIGAETVMLLDTPSVNTAPEAKDAAAATKTALCKFAAGEAKCS